MISISNAVERIPPNIDLLPYGNICPTAAETLQRRVSVAMGLGALKLESGEHDGVESNESTLFEEACQQNDVWTEVVLQKLEAEGGLTKLVSETITDEFRDCNADMTRPGIEAMVQEAEDAIVMMAEQQLRAKAEVFRTMIFSFSEDSDNMDREKAERLEDEIAEIKEWLSGQTRPVKKRSILKSRGDALYDTQCESQNRMAKRTPLPVSVEIEAEYSTSAIAGIRRSVYGSNAHDARVKSERGSAEEALKEEAFDDNFQKKYFGALIKDQVSQFDVESNAWASEYEISGRLVALSPNQFTANLVHEELRKVLYEAGPLSDALDDAVSDDYFFRQKGRAVRKVGGYEQWNKKENKSTREEWKKREKEAHEQAEADYRKSEQNFKRRTKSQNPKEQAGRSQRKAAPESLFDGDVERDALLQGIQSLFDSLKINPHERLSVADVVMSVAAGAIRDYSGQITPKTTRTILRHMIFEQHPDRGGSEEMTKIITHMFADYKMKVVDS